MNKTIQGLLKEIEEFLLAKISEQELEFIRKQLVIAYLAGQAIGIEKAQEIFKS